MRLRRSARPRFQRRLPFLDRQIRLERAFKTAILVGTVVLVGIVLMAVPRPRGFLVTRLQEAGLETLRVVGVKPSRSARNALEERRRAQAIRDTRASVTDFYNKLKTFDPPLKHLFDVVGIDPEHVLIGSGRADNAFILAPGVFELDSHGRNYRLKPNVRALWIRQDSMIGGVVGLFLAPDTSEVRSAARQARAVLDEPSRQTTNSWGLRGSEPDLDAQVRGLVLGDSFMLGMLNGDGDTPPAALERQLPGYLHQSVDILNTGLMGYSPRQYFFTLKEFGPRFQPHFVVVSVCPNDFGEEKQVLAGRGEDWSEGIDWIDQIRLWCESRDILCLLVPIPCDPQLLGHRRDSAYPGRVCDGWKGPAGTYCNLLPFFVNEHLRTQRLGRRSGIDVGRSALHNTRVADGHLSPLGAQLWGRIVAYRLSLLLNPPKPAYSWPSTSVTTPRRGSDSGFPGDWAAESDHVRPMIAKSH